MKVIIIVSLLYLSMFAKEASTTIDLVNDIALNSQKIANNYLLIFNKKSRYNAEKKVYKLILSLEEDYRNLARSLKNEQQKQMLEYLSYNKDQIKEILSKKPNKDNANEIQDISRTLLEGCSSFIGGEEHLSDYVGLEVLNNSYIVKALKLDSDIETSDILKNISKRFGNKRSWKSYKKLYEKRDNFFPNLLMILSEKLESNR